MKIEINSQFEQALDLLENGKNLLFITGRAGTGKSTLLKLFRSKTTKKIAVVAPTGVAAINVEGDTIHSFFKFKPAMGLSEARTEGRKAKGKPLGKMFENLDILIIDEISMVRADLFDCMNVFLQEVLKRDQPFGGLRLALFGDLYQLPPVVTSKDQDEINQAYESPYFFDSHIMQDLFGVSPIQLDFIELEKIYRQTEEDYIRLLNAIRDKTLTEHDVEVLNSRVIPEQDFDVSDGIIMTTTNAKSDEINTSQLSRIKGPALIFEAQISGNFEKSFYPTDEVITLKKGTRVMMVKNDSSGRYVNGTLGTVKKLLKGDDDEESGVLILLDNGNEIEAFPDKWQLSRSVYNSEKKSLERESIGTFIQIPLRLAWSITIHKAQGKTFDKVLIDLGRSVFAAGQTYVALSRCTSFEGTFLSRPLRLSDVRLDYRILKFLTKIQYSKAKENTSTANIEQQVRDAVDSGSKLQIVYLKARNIKSERLIEPFEIGKMEYSGHFFIGVRAFCHSAGEERVFNLERILSAVKFC